MWWGKVLLLLMGASYCLGSVMEQELNVLFEEEMEDILGDGGKPQAHKPKVKGVRTYKLTDKQDGLEEKEKTENVTQRAFEKPDLISDIRRTYNRYHEMVLVRGGTFWMGTNFPESTTGEYPIKEVPVDSFYLDKNPVINADYWAYRSKKKFVRTDAEVRGWSWVVDLFLTDETREFYSMPGSTGWAAVKRANWNAPEGPGSNLADRWTHPVVHISWYDAKTYCEYQGKRLPTEQEWEYAARAGARGMNYPWGDSWERKRANIWQGAWPYQNTKGDGYGTTSPVDAFICQNLIGFYDMIGNVWEWTSSAYIQKMVPAHLQSKMTVLKGGSFVDSVNGYVNAAVRNGNRMGQAQDYTAANVGFRCAKDAPAKFKASPEELELGQQAKRRANLQQKKPAEKRIRFHRRDEL